MSKSPPHHPRQPVEFSHIIGTDKVPSAGMVLLLKPHEKQLNALAERFGLLKLSKLTADLKIMPQSIGTHGFTVTGTVEADAIQQCVVTLEPLPVHIKTPVQVTYIEDDDQRRESGEIDLTHDADDVEYVENGIIDLGELTAQHLGVSLDPYPRKPGLSPIEAEYGEDDKPENPFAKLAELKKSSKKPDDK